MTTQTSAPVLAVTALLSACFGAAVGVRFAAPGSRDDRSESAPDPSSVHDILRARNLEIVDEQGRVCGGFAAGTGSSRNVHLWLHRGDPDDPRLSLRVDDLEGTQEARIVLRSSGGPHYGDGETTVGSMSGRGHVVLSRLHPVGASEIVHLQHPLEEGDAVLRHKRGERLSQWP